MKKILTIFLICLFPLAVLFLIFTLRFKPDGGTYWTFIHYAPEIVAGDGSSFQNAYQLSKGVGGSVATVEIETIRDRYWVGPGRSQQDFYHRCYDTLAFAHTNEAGHAYDVIRFVLPTGTNTVYFDVTAYGIRN